MSPVNVSVVMPCLNEEKTLAGCIESAQEGIKAAGITGEIIIADNDSTDKSVEIARSLGAKVVPCSRLGYGNALRAGFRSAEGEWIIMGDADQSYDFSEIPRFQEKIKEGYDLVMGNRFGGSVEKGAMPWLHRYIGNPLLSCILRVFFKVGVSDAHCGLRAFTRAAMEKMDLRTGGMELASEIVIKAVKVGLRITEIPIVLHRDARDRVSHLRTFRDGWRHLRYMLMMSPTWLFVLPGVFLTLMGSMIIAILMPGPLSVGGVVLDVHTMLLGMALVLLGVYLFLLGCFVKVFIYTERFAVSSGFLTKLVTRVKLEHGLLLSVILIVIGFGGDLWFLWSWKQAGFGALEIPVAMRWAILFTTLLVVGIELFFASFFLSMLGISRGDYIGEYTKNPCS